MSIGCGEKCVFDVFGVGRQRLKREAELPKASSQAELGNETREKKAE
jgi:hypothetical protein